MLELGDKSQRSGLICVFGTGKIWTVSTLGIKFYVKVWGNAVGQSIVNNLLRDVRQINPNKIRKLHLFFTGTTLPNNPGINSINWLVFVKRCSVFSTGEQLNFYLQ